MAKNRKKQSGGRKESRISLEMNLPQNIVAVGEIPADSDRRIYISQPVYNIIHKFAKTKLENERGGVLVGSVIREFGKTNILVQGFIEAKYTEATSTTLKFTHETWEYVHKEIARRFDNGKIVGWIHTHPNYGIFLSEYDIFIHSNFFSDENQIAYVVDPIRHDEGVFCWVNGKIEHSRGFYVFDQPDRVIRLSPNGGAEDPDETENHHLAAGRMLIYGIIVVIVLLIVSLALIGNNLFNRISILESQQETMAADTADLKSQNAYLEQRVYLLELAENQIIAAINQFHGTTEPPEESLPDEKGSNSIPDMIVNYMDEYKDKVSDYTFSQDADQSAEENPE